MKCKNDCGNDAVSKGTKPAKYCSDACRKSYKRTQDKKRTEQTDGIELQTDSGIRVPSVVSQSVAQCDQSVASKTLTEKIADKTVFNNGDPSPPLDKSKQGVVKPANFGEPNCECWHCRNNRASGSRNIINHGATKRCNELGRNELNRVSLPGDVDYAGVASGI